MNVALYVRVSTEEQKRHGLSVDAQIDRLTRWAHENGHDIVDIYNDAGLSARKPAAKRPEIQRLLSDIQNNRIQLVSFTKLDRWFRSVAEYYKAQEVLDRYKVPWTAVDEDYETQTASGQFKVNIMLAVAQSEADRTSERIKSVFEHKRAKGEVVSGSAPTGYKVEQKHLVFDETKKDAVAYFFDRYLATGEQTVTSDMIRERFGLHITWTMADHMLKSRTYMGQTKSGPCPAYITPEQYEQIQKLRKHNVRRAKDNRCYLFTGLAKCEECGGRFRSRSRPSRSGGDSYIYYSCIRREQKAGCTNFYRFSQNTLEQWLIEHLEFAIEEYATASENDRKAFDPAPMIAAQKKRIDRLKDLYVDGLIDRDELKRRTDEVQSKIDKLQQQISKPKQSPLIIEKMGGSRDWVRTYKELSDRGKREFWLNVLDNVTISADGSFGFTIR